MGFWDWLFGKSESDSEASVESDDRVEARAPSTPPARSAPPPASPPKPSAPPPPKAATGSVAPPPLQQLEVHAPADVPQSFGIQRAIELMRALPLDDDPSLVLRVVRKTLKSSGVSLEEIITSANGRETAIGEGIGSDRATIERLEAEIATRRENIKRLEVDLEETQNVRAWLEEALQSETKIGSVSPQEILRIQMEAAASARARKSRPPPGSDQDHED